MVFEAFELDLIEYFVDEGQAVASGLGGFVGSRHYFFSTKPRTPMGDEKNKGGIIDGGFPSNRAGRPQIGVAMDVGENFVTG